MARRSNAVLLVDDDEMLLRAMARSFRFRGYADDISAERSVTSVPSIKSAREAVRTRWPDLAIVDWRLGDGCGIALAHELRQRDAGLTIVLVSGDENLVVRHGYDAGANQVLSKPFSIEKVLARIDRCAPDPHALTAAQAARKHQIEALAECGGNVTRAAALLGVTRQALQRSLRKRPKMKRELADELGENVKEKRGLFGNRKKS